MKRRPSLGPERYILAVALLIPVILVLFVAAQVPGVTLAAPTQNQADRDAAQLVKRPPPSRAEPPPTLVPPTATPRAAAAPAPPVAPAPTVAPTDTPEKNRTYTVQPGDELKNIAASYNVSIWKVIQSNNIPNPDSLRVGQVLTIPDD